MNKISLVGIDLAKNVFQVCALNKAGKILFNRQVTRAQLAIRMEQIPATVVAMESCSSAHYWARRFQAMGHTVRLIPAQHCAPFVRGGKNDARDALAICEAAQRPNMRFVPVKSVERQDLQLLLRVRHRLSKNMTAMANQIRGIGREYGVVLPLGIPTLKRELPDVLEDADNALSPVARRLLAQLLEELLRLRMEKKALFREIEAVAAQQPGYDRLREIPGFGVICTACFLAAVGDGRQFKNGRQVAAWAGLVPRQYGTGGKVQLHGITKNGDRYLRTTLVHGAGAVTCWARRRPDPLGRWILPTIERRGFNRAVVAMANKMARIGWNVLTTDQHFDPSQAFGKA